MPIKTINDLIMQGIKPERVNSLRKEKPKPNPHFKMQEVVPPLNRGDFLNSWKSYRAQLEKVRKERDDAVKETKRLKGIMQTTWSKDWWSTVNEKEKK
jgi:hypothetical protein